jgi:hypothetical protein
VAAACLVPTRLSAQGYFREDYQYFRQIPADLRTSQNHMRFYFDEPLAFSNSTSQSKHLFFDASLGEYFPLIGLNFGPVEPLRTPGLVFFVDAAAHLLLDWQTASSDAINTDYRIGAGVAFRAPRLRSLAARYRYFHESTHLGDEYTLYASQDTAFRRYNVSYEAHELFVAIDRYRAEDSLSGGLDRALPYARVYGALRQLDTDLYDGFTGLYAPAAPIQLSSKYEAQFGGEVYFRGWPSPMTRPSDTWISRLFAPQHFLLGADLKRQDQYGTATAHRSWSSNVVFGIVYGQALGTTSEPTVRWELNWYNGINPHGQFRSERLSYLGFNFVIDF